MNCVEISYKICDLIEKQREESIQRQSNIIRKQDDNDDTWIADDIAHNYFDNEVTNEYNKLLQELYTKSSKEEFYFFDAPLKVYKNFFDVQMIGFLKKHKDASKKDYLEQELEKLNNPSNNRFLINSDGNKIFYHHYLKKNLDFKISLDKKKEYLITRIHKAKFEIGDNNQLIPKKEIIIPFNSKSPLDHKYLKEFCKSISRPSEVNDTSFINLYKTSITHFTPYLENEIISNLLQLDKDDKLLYLDYVRKKVLETPFSNLNTEYILFWLEENNEKIEDFPYFNKGKFYNLLNTYCNGNHLEYEQSLMLRELQKDFFRFASFIQVKKIIYFLNNYTNQLKVETTQLINNQEAISKLKWIGKPSQLGFIISSLVQLGYIEAPLKKDGEINYSQFAKMVLETFDAETTNNTLEKYLNLDSEKGQETLRKFNSNKFSVPHIKEVS